MRVSTPLLNAEQIGTTLVSRFEVSGIEFRKGESVLNDNVDKDDLS